MSGNSLVTCLPFDRHVFAIVADNVHVPFALDTVSCQPAAGTTNNLHGEESWLQRHRKPVDDDGLPPGIKPEQQCYKYTAVTGDTVADIVDHFDLDIRAFVRENANVVGELANLTFKWPMTLRAEELASVLRIVTNATGGAAKQAPFFACSYFEASGKEATVECNSVEATGNSACEAKGIVGECRSFCTLVPLLAQVQ